MNAFKPIDGSANRVIGVLPNTPGLAFRAVRRTPSGNARVLQFLSPFAIFNPAVYATFLTFPPRTNQVLPLFSDMKLRMRPRGMVRNEFFNKTPFRLR